MISIHMDTSPESLQHLLVSASRACSASLLSSVHLLHALHHFSRESSPACSASMVDKSFIRAVMAKSFTLTVMMGFACQTAGQLQTRALVMSFTLSDYSLIHLSNARAVVMVLSLSGFSDIFSIIWCNLSLMVIRQPRVSCRLVSTTRGLLTRSPGVRVLLARFQLFGSDGPRGVARHSSGWSPASSWVGRSF